MLNPRFSQVVKNSLSLCDRADELAANPLLSGNELESAVVKSRDAILKDGKLRIALVGQFGAGKSSIIKALTRKDVLIDADVSTSDVSEFDWNGLVLLDTPGVQAQASATGHDAISRRATSAADLVVFVVSNELFNDRLVEYFHALAGRDGLALSGKMVVIVNKMDRETNDPVVILGEVSKAIAPHGEIPVLLCAARRALDAEEEKTPLALREKFRQQSGIAELVRRIDALVEGERATAGRISTPLQALEEALQEAMEHLGGAGEENGKRVELFRRQRKILTGAISGFDDAILKGARDLRSKSSAAAEKGARELNDTMGSEALEQLIGLKLQEFVRDADDVFEAVNAKLRDIMAEAMQQMEELGESSLGRAVHADLKRSGKQSSVNMQYGQSSNGRMGRDIYDVLKKPLAEGVKSLAKDPKYISKAALKYGKMLGHKFRPWDAVKLGGDLAKFAGGLAKALPFVSVAIDIWFAHSEEKAEDKRRTEAARTRSAIHHTFFDQCAMEEQALRQGAGELRRKSLDAALSELEALAEAIVSTSKERGGLAEKLGACLSDSMELRRRLMGI